MIMFSDQHQVRISPNFPPEERIEPILPGIGTSNWNVGPSKVEVDPSTEEENVWKSRQEGTTHPNHIGFPVPKLELPMFNRQKPRWWIKRCEKMFMIHQVAENQRVALALAYLNDSRDIWFQGEGVL